MRDSVDVEPGGGASGLSGRTAQDKSASCVTETDVIHSEIARLRERTRLLDGETVTDVLGRVDNLVAELDALRLQLVRQIEASEVWRHDLNGTANSWLRSQHGHDHRSAESALRAARALAAYPALRAAADAGLISRAHIDVIVAVGEATPTRREHLAEFMSAFVEVAQHAPPSTLRKVMRRWADQIDPISICRDEADAHHRRYLHVNHVGDGVALDAFFDHVQGRKVLAALNAALTAQYRAATRGAERTDASGGISASGGSVGDEPDSPMVGTRLATAQQRADAFIAGIIDPILANGELPSTGGSRPMVTVIVPLERLERPCHAPTDPRTLRADTAKLQGATAIVAAGVDADRLFSLGSATVGVTNGPGESLISSQAAQRLTCDCEIHRLVVDPDGLPLDVGRTMRTFPPHMRRALVIRDGGCVFPGCDRPPGWAEAHHIVHWAQGGKTSLDNAALLCSKHHHQVHAEGHTVEIGEDGRGRVLVRNHRFVE